MLIGSHATLSGRAAGKLVMPAYNKHLAALRAGMHANKQMQAEFSRLAGRGLLCKVIETPN